MSIGPHHRCFIEIGDIDQHLLEKGDDISTPLIHRHRFRSSAQNMIDAGLREPHQLRIDNRPTTINRMIEGSRLLGRQRQRGHSAIVGSRFLASERIPM